MKGSNTGFNRNDGAEINGVGLRAQSMVSRVVVESWLLVPEDAGKGAPWGVAPPFAG